MQVEGVPHTSPPPNFIHFIKKKNKATVWAMSQASSREWDGLVADCPAVPHAS